MERLEDHLIRPFHQRHLTCMACDLHKTRTQVVPGWGNPQADIMLIGEAPGRDEDRLGQPFVGRAGRLLDEILAEVPLCRKNLFITNVISCRPPRNDIRSVPNSLIVCPPLWLEPAIEMINPKVIVAMGATAAVRWFPGKSAHQVSELARALPDGRIVVGSFHPAYSFRAGTWVNELILGSLRRAVELCQ